jgi:hypothetical protein
MMPSKDTPMKRILLVLLGILVSLIASTQIANAATSFCYSIISLYVHCDPDLYYCSDYTEDICFHGCQGPYCGTGWGYCCDRSYKTQIVYGDRDQCDPGLCGLAPFRNDLIIDRQFHSNATSKPISQRLVPKPAYYVPSRCVGLYGIVEPAEVYRSQEGL